MQAIAETFIQLSLAMNDGHRLTLTQGISVSLIFGLKRKVATHADTWRRKPQAK